MVAPLQHYRWDFYGLSTDDKPTADTSEKVADGSTYYEADTSKLYVWYDDAWYEKEDGGGTPYVLPIASADTLGGVKVGSGLTIDSETGSLSVSGGPTTVIQNAGAPTTATEGTVGLLLEDTTNGKLYQCTAVNEPADENDPTTYTWVEVGQDLVDGVIIKNAGAPTTATVGAIGLLLEDTTNGKLYQCTAITAGVDPDPTTYTWTEVGAGSAVTVVQTRGTSQTDVMSQDAATKLVFSPCKSTNPTYHDTITIGDSITIDNRSWDGVSIGNDITNTGTYAIAIGKSASLSGANPNGQYGVAIGAFSVNNGEHSIALGDHSRIEYSEKGVMDIGLHGVSGQGYNNGNNRKLKGIATMGSNEADETSAANLAYVKLRINATGTAAPTTSTTGVIGGLYSYVDTTGSTPVTRIYQCVNITNQAEYIWVDITTEVKAKIDALIITNAGAPTTATVGTVGQLLEDTTNGKLYQCTAVTAGVDPDPTTYTWTEVGAGGGSGPTVVQTTGTSTTDVMSQNAVTGLIYADPSAKRRINIGNGSSITANDSVVIGGYGSVSGVYSVGIGYNSLVNATHSVGVGNDSYTSAQYTVAIGDGARATAQGEFNIGTGTSGNHGYNSTNYRLLTGVHNPVSAHDAATKDYVDGLVGNVASALNVINNGSNS